MNNNMPMDMMPMHGMGMMPMNDNMGQMEPMMMPGMHAGCNCSRELSMVSHRVNMLDRDMKRLERRVETLEGFHRPRSEYSNTAGVNENVQYQSGNYML